MSQRLRPTTTALEPPPPPPGAQLAPIAAAAEATGPTDLVRDRAHAMLPDDLLQPDELIILLIKPSPWFILLESLRTLMGIAVVLGVAVVSIRTLALQVNPRDLVLASIAVGGVRLFWQFLEWMSRVYVLTDRRVIRVMGVVRIQVFECQLKKIQHTNALFSLRERLFGLGTIGFSTAGSGPAEAYWRMVARPLEVHQIVLQTIGRYR